MQSRPESSLWVQTATGVAVDLLTPRPEQIRAADIGISLARLVRFNGHTAPSPAAYTVARHSLLAESLLPDDMPATVRLAVLLHDAHEAYTGDIVSPVKWAIRHMLAQDGVELDPLGVLQDDLQFAIVRAVGLDQAPLPPNITAIIKQCDLVALAIEKRDLMRPEPRPWGDLPRVPDLPGGRCSPLIYQGDDRGDFLRRLVTLISLAGVRPLPSFRVVS